ncbi:MAG: hypothetical protein ACLQBA_20945 [Candidatus Binataceae bacterium]
MAISFPRGWFGNVGMATLGQGWTDHYGYYFLCQKEISNGSEDNYHTNTDIQLKTATMAILRAILLAEDINVDGRGKATLEGFLGLSPWVIIGIPYPDRPIPKLSFLCLSGEPVDIGEYVIGLQVIAPDGEPLLSSILEQTLLADRRSPLGAIFQVDPFPMKGVGRYGLQFLINNEADLLGAFTINQGPVPAIR